MIEQRKSGWWRESDNYASVGFQYIEWGRFEPQDDQFDWAYVEEVLGRPGTRGRHLILQFAVDWDDWNAKEPVGDSHYKGPHWLLERVGENRGPAFPDDPNSRISRATNYNHPLFIREATAAIKVLCDHFRDDPRTLVLQAGVIGYWGEWHTYPRTQWGPTDATKRSIIDAYLNNLGPDGLTQIRYPNEPAVKPRARLGYTNGSATLTDHGLEFGEAIAAGKLWKNGPIDGEWPPSVELKYWKKFFQTDEGKRFIEQAGYSTLLLPEIKDIAAKLPGWKPDARLREMHCRLGYNFQAKEARHLVAVDDSGRTYIEVDLHNSGIAPFYKDWKVQLAIINSETAEVFQQIDIDTDIRKLGPSETMTLVGTADKKLDPRDRYQFALRICQPSSDKPKTGKWTLNDRNTYIVLANDVKVIEGKRNQSEDVGSSQLPELQGGWNILSDIERRQPRQPQQIDGQTFPLQGSFRPIDNQVPRPTLRQN